MPKVQPTPDGDSRTGMRYGEFLLIPGPKLYCLFQGVLYGRGFGHGWLTIQVKSIDFGPDVSAVHKHQGRGKSVAVVNLLVIHYVILLAGLDTSGRLHRGSGIRHDDLYFPRG